MNVEPNPHENVFVNSKLVASKLRSKKECFQFLVVDCQVYLPDDPACVTTYFLKQLCKKTGKLLKGGEPDFNNISKQIIVDW